MGQLDDFMNSLADNTVKEVDKEYREVEDKYEKKFGHVVPMEMLPPSLSKEDIKRAMLTCIDSGNDNIFEILHVQIDDKYLY